MHSYRRIESPPGQDPQWLNHYLGGLQLSLQGQTQTLCIGGENHRKLLYVFPHTPVINLSGVSSI